ncbi:hypothetical protein HanPSC8_Chr02g0061611 [Helianthus annuus]|nr:hypothetical protein HanPSC8_Chr02g0061611 [Helianthus annuus]
MISVTINRHNLVISCHLTIKGYLDLWFLSNVLKTGTFTHDKTISVYIPWSRSRLWVIISLRKGPARHKTTQTNRNNGSFSATSNHHVSFPSSNMICSSIKAII